MFLLTPAADSNQLIQASIDITVCKWLESCGCRKKSRKTISLYKRRTYCKTNIYCCLFDVPHSAINFHLCISCWQSCRWSQSGLEMFMLRNRAGGENTGNVYIIKCHQARWMICMECCEITVEVWNTTLASSRNVGVLGTAGSVCVREWKNEAPCETDQWTNLSLFKFQNYGRTKVHPVLASSIFAMPTAWLPRERLFGMGRSPSEFLGCHAESIKSGW